jgi:hypothetical protein
MFRAPGDLPTLTEMCYAENSALGRSENPRNKSVALPTHRGPMPLFESMPMSPRRDLVLPAFPGRFAEIERSDGHNCQFTI